MTQKVIYEIALELQNRFVPIAVSQGKVKLVNNTLPREQKFTWENCLPDLNLLDTGNALDPDKLSEFRKLFPTARRSSRAEEEQRIRMFLLKYAQYTLDDIIRVATKYTLETDPQYTMTSGYFISKKIPGQAETRKVLNYLEAEEDEDNSEDYEHL